MLVLPYLAYFTNFHELNVGTLHLSRYSGLIASCMLVNSFFMASIPCFGDFVLYCDCCLCYIIWPNKLQGNMGVTWGRGFHWIREEFKIRRRRHEISLFTFTVHLVSTIYLSKAMLLNKVHKTHMLFHKLWFILRTKWPMELS